VLPSVHQPHAPLTPATRVEEPPRHADGVATHLEFLQSEDVAFAESRIRVKRSPLKYILTTSAPSASSASDSQAMGRGVK